jgi:hypothetical protein
MNGRAEQLRLVEALLFAADEPLGEEAMSRHFDEAMFPDCCVFSGHKGERAADVDHTSPALFP